MRALASLTHLLLAHAALQRALSVHATADAAGTNGGAGANGGQGSHGGAAADGAAARGAARSLLSSGWKLVLAGLAFEQMVLRMSIGSDEPRAASSLPLVGDEPGASTAVIAPMVRRGATPTHASSPPVDPQSPSHPH